MNRAGFADPQNRDKACLRENFGVYGVRKIWRRLLREAAA
jgi:hypothetical protein